MSGYIRGPIIVGRTPTVRVFRVRCMRPNASYYELRNVVQREWGGSISYVDFPDTYVTPADWYWESATVYLPRAASLSYVRIVMSRIGWSLDRILTRF